MSFSDDEEAQSQSGSESESELEEVAAAKPSMTAIYNKEGLIDKLEDISWPTNVDWMHKLTYDHSHEQEINVNDDIARELAFYTQALEGTRWAYAKLQPRGIPFFRPSDYYAEMVKSDTHMLKIKEKLLVEKQKIEEGEERKKAREAKKIAKEVQAQKLKERNKMRKEGIENVKKWRKQRQQSGFAGGNEDELESMFNDGKSFPGSSKKRKAGVAPGDRSGGVWKHGGKFGQGKDNKKRQHRDSKYGHGGRKGMKKQNTADTMNDFRAFNKGGGAGNKRRKM